MASFPSIRIEGGLFGSDLLDQIVTGELKGQKPADFGLDPKRNLTDEIAAAFADARALWGVFQNRLARVAADDPATTVTRDSWMIPFLALLGYEVRFNQRAFEVDGQTYAISHRAGEAEDAPPVHIVGNRQQLGRVSPTGRPRLSPHSLVQEYLNRTEHVWGLVTNGSVLRVLRDSTFVRRQSYLEFDLEGILEEQRFHDFAALYRLIHRTRLPHGMADAGECRLENYYQHSEEQGGRVLDHLRDGVERCLVDLANGFLHHPPNEELRRRASPDCVGNECIAPAAMFRQLLRLVYRFLFLLVSEERGLLSPDPVYREHYGIVRLRRLLEQRSSFSDYEDVAQSLGVLWQVFRTPKYAELLKLAPLNGELFEEQFLDFCSITNRNLLNGFWNLCYYQETISAPPRRVNYAALDVEELGSVYESLLEFHPALDRDGSGRLVFSLIFGSERKTTGSYYTPPELVNELIQSALEPVIQNRLAAQPNDREKALLSIRVCDPACGSGHFLLAAARRIAKELARVRSGEDEPAPEQFRGALRDVISHCIYGVDKNPLAVDLCRLALWLESHTGNKPLTFLDHRIRCGDSLVGVFDLSVLRQGIPDKAFKPSEGDDDQVARAAAKRNKEEKRGFQDLFARRDSEEMESLTQHSREVDAIPDDSPELIRRKKELFEASHRDPAWLRQKQACDLWTGAFFQTLTADSIIITSAALADHISGRPIDARLLGGATALALRQPFFHWPLEFPEVFAAGGFDVILGNPPWIRQELFKSLKNRLSIFDSYKSTADLSAFFLEISVKLLRLDGYGAMLTPNKWFRASYGEPLREFLRRNTRIVLIIDFGHSKNLFRDADTFPACVVFRRVSEPPLDSVDLEFVRAYDEDRRALPLSQLISKKTIAVSYGSLAKTGWVFNDAAIQSVLAKLRALGRPLSEEIDSQLYYGLKTGFNEAFYLEGPVARSIVAREPQSESLIKPFVRGRDIKRWNVVWDDQWHIVIPSSQNRDWPWSNAPDAVTAELTFARSHPLVYAHLKVFEDPLRNRTDQGVFWWELRSCDYYPQFERSKIAISRISYHSSCGLDDVGYFQNDSTVVIPTQDLFVLAVLNSSIAWWFMTLTFPHKKDEALAMDADYLEKFPLPVPNQELKAQIRTVCQNLRHLSSEPTTDHNSRLAVERQLSELVLQAYGLNDSERASLAIAPVIRDPISVLEKQVSA